MNANGEWSESMTLTFSVCVCMIVCLCVCVAVLRTGRLCGKSPWKVTFPFFLSFFTLLLPFPVPPSSALLISLRYGSQWHLLLLLCADQSSPFFLSCLQLCQPHPSPPSITTVHWLAVFFLRHAAHHDSELRGVWAPARWWIQDCGSYCVSWSVEEFTVLLVSIKPKVSLLVLMLV